MSLEEKMNSFEPGPQLIFRNVSELDPAPATEMQPSTRREAVILSLPQRIPLAVELAKALGIPPDVFGVQALRVESEWGEGATCEYDVALEGLRDWLRGQAVGQEEQASRRIGCVVRFGQPEQKIPETAAELRCDMIIMGARGLGANPHKPGHFVGGTAYEVACSSYCPVLVVPEPVKTGEGSSIRITSGMMQTAPQATGGRVSRR